MPPKPSCLCGTSFNLPIMSTIWIVGAGGHAKVVIDTLRATETVDVLGVLDDDRTRQGTEVLGVPVRGEASLQSIGWASSKPSSPSAPTVPAPRWPGGWPAGCRGRPQFIQRPTWLPESASGKGRSFLLEPLSSRV